MKHCELPRCGAASAPTNPSPPHASDKTAHASTDFYVARQPILNRHGELYAYEILFRTGHNGGANVSDERFATASVVAHVTELGIDNVIGDALGFLNVDASVLLGDFIQFVPRDRIVLEILETVEPTDQILDRIRVLKGKGYRFALDDVIDTTKRLERYLPLMDIVKVDILGLERDKLTSLVRPLLASGKLLLAEKVETETDRELCSELGFSLFQGYYFAKPKTLSGKKIEPSILAIVELLGLLGSDCETTVIEAHIKRHASITINLLRLVNTAAAGARRTISSVNQALMVLGRRQLQRWLEVLLYANAGATGSAKLHAPLLVLAATRGKLLELMSLQLRPRSRGDADIAFTVGVMSLIETLFSMPMRDLLMKLPVNGEVSDALLARVGFHGKLLTLVEWLENPKRHWGQVVKSASEVGLTAGQIVDIQKQAYEWANSLND